MQVFLQMPSGGCAGAALRQGSYPHAPHRGASTASCKHDPGLLFEAISQVAFVMLSIIQSEIKLVTIGKLVRSQTLKKTIPLTQGVRKSWCILSSFPAVFFSEELRAEK